VEEETGMRLVVAGAADSEPNSRTSCEGFATGSLAVPMPFAAVDSIVHCSGDDAGEETAAAAAADPSTQQDGANSSSSSGRLRFHYVIVEVRWPVGNGTSPAWLSWQCALAGAVTCNLRPLLAQVAALAADPFTQQPVAGDDADDVAWVAVADLRSMGTRLVPGCAALAEEAVRRFAVPPAAALPALVAEHARQC
jgi:hypothetical protein